MGYQGNFPGLKEAQSKIKLLESEKARLEEMVKNLLFERECIKQSASHPSILFEPFHAKNFISI